MAVREENGLLVVYCAYIVKNGKRIYPRKAKCFRFVIGVAKTKKAA